MSEERRSGLLLGVDPVAGYTSSQSHGGARMDDGDGGGDGDSGDGGGDSDGGDGDSGDAGDN